MFCLTATDMDLLTPVFKAYLLRWDENIPRRAAWAQTRSVCFPTINIEQKSYDSCFRTFAFFVWWLSKRSFQLILWDVESVDWIWQTTSNIYLFWQMTAFTLADAWCSWVWSWVSYTVQWLSNEIRILVEVCMSQSQNLSCSYVQYELYEKWLVAIFGPTDFESHCQYDQKCSPIRYVGIDG
jgi:hypothetical protein